MAPPAAVDLSAQGPLDWAHWGADSPTSLNRKTAVPPQIGEFVVLGPEDPYRFVDSRVNYTWSDGAPTAVQSGTTTGLFFRGTGNGYRLVVPADTVTRTFTLYLSAYRARGRLEARLSDGSAAPFVGYVDGPTGNSDRALTLMFNADSPTQSLEIIYTLEADHGDPWSNITLQGATLAGGPPVLDPIGDQIVQEGQTLAFTVTASDPDGTIPSFSVSGLPDGAQFVDHGDGSGTFTWATATGDFGVYPDLTFSASDGPLSASETITIRVNGANRAPAIVPVEAQRVFAGHTLLFDVQATDPDGTIPALSVNGLPAGAQFVDHGDGRGTFTWGTAASDIGLYSGVTVQAFDGELSASEPVTIQVLSGVPQLSGSLTSPPAAVDLSAQGALDWVHWGADSPTSLNRKAAVVPQIGEYTVFGPESPYRFVDARVSYSWSDGLPTAAQSGTTTGLFFRGGGNGFQFVVPANTHTRTITLYLGAYRAQGRLEARLSDGSATPFVGYVDSPAGSTDQALTLMFSAGSPGQSLEIVYTLEADYGDPWSNITLQGAALAGSPPVLDPIGDQIVQEGQTLSFTVTASDPDGTIPSLSVSGLPGESQFVDHGDGSGTFTWATAAGDFGVYPDLTFSASDGLLTASETIAIRVNGANRAPAIAPVEEQRVFAGHTLIFNVQATDPNGTVPNLSVSGLPGGAQFVDHGDGRGTFTWATAAGDIGLYSGVSVQAFDGELSVGEHVTIRVLSGAPQLSGSLTPPPAVVNLSSQGTLDWVHWGAESPTSLNRKTSVSPQIGEFVVFGPESPFRFVDSRVSYSWSDGAPTAVQSGTTTGLFFRGAGNGYRFVVPADTHTRTIKLYLGAYRAQGRLEARLSDGSAAPFVGYVDSPAGSTDREMILMFNAGSAGQSLEIVYTFEADYGDPWSNITLQGATLTGGPPVLDPIGDQIVQEGQTLTFTVTASDPDGTIPSLSVSGLPGGAQFVDHGDGSGTFTWATAAGDFGVYSDLTFSASDGPLAASETITIRVNGANRAPAIAPVEEQLVFAGYTLIFNVQATDPDGTIPSLSVSELPGDAQFVDHGDGSGTFTWATAAGDIGLYSGVSVQAFDGELSVGEPVTIRVLSGVPQLSGSLTPPPAAVNLSAQGPLDWVHWGAESPTSLNRKTAVSPQIGEPAVLGPESPYRFDDARISYSWNDGAPTVVQSGTNTGLFFRGAGNGYRFVVPADTTTRTLTLYLGAYRARGRLEARLSDGSAAPFVGYVDSPAGSTDREMTLMFNAGSGGQSLEIVYTLETDYGDPWSNVNLQAATLMSGEVPSSLPIVQDFNVGGTEEWMVVDDSNRPSAWAVIDGELHQTNRVENQPGAFDQSFHKGTYAYLVSEQFLTNYILNVEATYLDAIIEDDIGVMFRYQNNDNYYRLSFNSRYGFTRLEKKVNGVFSTFASNSRGYVLGEKIDVEIELRGAMLFIRLNGEPLFSVEDHDLYYGTVGLYSQGYAKFDNVSIVRPGELPSVTLSSPLSHWVTSSDQISAVAVATNVPPNAYVEFLLDGVESIEDHSAPFSAQFSNLVQGDHTVEAILRGADATELARDINTQVGVKGDYFISLGDSITLGLYDNFASDNQSSDGRIISSGGYEANFSDLHRAAVGYPVLVGNEGVGGDTSADALNRIDSILARRPASNKALILLGTNDSEWMPSGLGCTVGLDCDGTFKGNMQTLVDRLVAAGKETIVGLVPPVFSPGVDGTPLTNPRNSVVLKDYNQIIQNELMGVTIGPDFNTFFLNQSENLFSLFTDPLHPNALGYSVIAALWNNALTGDTYLPFFLGNLAPSTISPYLKQNLLESGDRYYVDESFVIAGSIPPNLYGGRWIMTPNADYINSDPSYLSFSVDRPVTVYVGYDAGATSAPLWLSSFWEVGLSLETTDPQTPNIKLFSKSYPAGTISLGGNMAVGASGANSNYIVVVVEE